MTRSAISPRLAISTRFTNGPPGGGPRGIATSAAEEDRLAAAGSGWKISGENDEAAAEERVVPRGAGVDRDDVARPDRAALTRVEDELGEREIVLRRRHVVSEHAHRPHPGGARHFERRGLGTRDRTH